MIDLSSIAVKVADSFMAVTEKNANPDDIEKSRVIPFTMEEKFFIVSGVSESPLQVYQRIVDIFSHVSNLVMLRTQDHQRVVESQTFTISSMLGTIISVLSEVERMSTVAISMLDQDQFTEMMEKLVEVGKKKQQNMFNDIDFDNLEHDIDFDNLELNPFSNLEFEMEVYDPDDPRWGLLN